MLPNDMPGENAGNRFLGPNAPIDRLRSHATPRPCLCNRGELVLPGQVCTECKRDADLARKRDFMRELRERRANHHDPDDDDDPDGPAGAIVKSTPTHREPGVFYLEDHLSQEDDRHLYEARLRRLWGRSFTVRRFTRGLRNPSQQLLRGIKSALAADPRIREIPGIGEARYERVPGASIDLAVTNALRHRSHLHHRSGEGSASA